MMKRVMACLGGMSLFILACNTTPQTPPSADTVIEKDVTAAPDVVADTTPADAFTLCTPYSTVCYSDLLTATCNDSGTTYVEINECPEGTLCQQNTGKCGFPYCYPNASECVDYWTARTCDESGSFWLNAVACDEDLYCEEGQCIACVPASTECVDDTTERQCAPDGLSWGEPAPCAEDETCVEGACFVCAPGATECYDQFTARTCDETGLGWIEYTACETDEICIGSACQACEIESTCIAPDMIQRSCTSEDVIFTEYITCEDQYFCVKGSCLYEGCFSNVLLLVDRSGSMSGEWNNVTQSVTTMVDQTDFARFGLIGFPSGGGCKVADSLEVDWTLADTAPFEVWFEAHNPTGSTPLADAIGNVLTFAPLIFGEKGGTMVVLSDGQDTCANGNVVQTLTDFTAALFVNFGVQTYVIGYNYNGDASELNAIAKHGGTDLQAYIPAGNEAELTEAFDSIVGDLKLCD